MSDTPKEISNAPFLADLLAKKTDTIKNPLANAEQSTVKNVNFDPTSKAYEYINNPTEYSTTEAGWANQGMWSSLGRGLKQFGANAVSSLGQTLAATFDITDAAKTIKSTIAGGREDFNSSFFGISTKDMMDWSEGVAKNNEVYEKNPGTFSPGDIGWWAKEMLPQTGTLFGTAVGAIASTVAIEALTGDAGTEYAMAKLGNNLKKIWKSSESAADIVKGGMDLAKGMRSAAAMYASISRFSEAKFEAQSNYRNTYNKLSETKKADGTAYTEDEKDKFASEGAKVDFGLTMAQLPLDILAMRAMIFNPISGAAEGGIERGLAKIAGLYGESKAGKAAGWLTTHGIGAVVEGFEAGGIPIFQREGEHHALKLAGLDDKTTFGERLSEEVGGAEFSNMVASGILGSLLIGPTLNAGKNLMNGNRAAKFNKYYSEYIKNVVPANDRVTEVISTLEKAGNTAAATMTRRAFNSQQALSRLHLDAQANKSQAYDAWINHLQSTLEQAKNGNFDNIKDLFGDVKPEQAEQVQKEFQTYLDDAKQMKSIYDNVKNRFNKNFVPAIAASHFQLNVFGEQQQAAMQRMTSLQSGLNQYNELSPAGMEQYNAEYQLGALQYEGKRLSDLHAATKDAATKDNIGQLIESNKAKLTALNNRLTEIGKDENYQPEQKAKDKEIISSALKNQEYHQAVYDNERLQNEISLTRKNLALWNDTSYTERKNKEAIDQAKTQEQLDKTNEDLKKNKQDTKETDEAVAKKTADFTAQEVAQGIEAEEIKPTEGASAEVEETQPADVESVIPASVEPPKVPADKVMGNSDLFGEAVNDLKGIPETFDEKTQKEAEFLLSPSGIDEGKFTPEQKDKVKKAVGAMLGQMSPDASFEDLVNAFQSQTDRDTADKHFNLLKEGWKLNGKAPVDFDAVYNKLFANPITAITEVGKVVFEENKAAGEAETGTDNDAEQKGQEAKGGQGRPVVDANNQVVYVYTGIVTDNEKPKLATLFRLHDETETINEDGTVSTQYNYTADELNEGQYVDSRPILNPDAYLEGTELVVKVPGNFMDIMIPVYNADGSKGQAMTFGQYISLNNLTPDMQAYKDKIPMIVYNKNTAAGEKGVAFVHDIAWYHPKRFLQSEPQKMQEAIDSTKAVREAALNGDASITITEKKTTSFEPFKTKNNGTKEAPKYEFISFAEANPQAIFAIAESEDSLQDNENFNNKDSVLLRNIQYKPGYVYDIRRAGWKDGKKSYLVFEVAPQPINDNVKTTLKQALFVYLNKNNSNSAVRAKHDEIVKQIQTQTGLNILQTRDLQTFVHQFINFRDFAQAQKNTDVDVLMNKEKGNNRTDNAGYIGFQIGGSIYVGARKLNAFTASSGAGNKGVQTIYSNPNAFDAQSVERLMKWLDAKYIPTRNGDGTAGSKMSILDSMNNNYSKEAAKKNKAVVHIDVNGAVSKVGENYIDYIKKTFTTNIKSENIAKEGEAPIYVTSTSMVSYDLTGKVKKESEPITVAEVVTQATQVDTQVEAKAEEAKANPDEERIAALLKEINDKAGKDLGIDFNNNDALDLLSVMPLTSTQRQTFNNEANRVAGLNSKENTELNNFIFGQIIPIVNEKGSISNKELQQQIYKILNDVLNPIKTFHKNEAIRLQGILDATPALKDTNVPAVIEAYNKEAARIEALQSKENKKALFNAAKDRVTSNLGIKEGKVDEVKEDGDAEYSEQNMEEREGWQIDTLSLDPNAKTSATLKRFYSAIPVLNADGTNKKGVFGLPTYYSLTEVGGMAKALLADTPADFDTMVAKLEQKQQYAWIPQLVAKLRTAPQQLKNQFVSDMSMSSLRMKFSMIIFDKKTNSYKTKAWDANQGGIIQTLLHNWNNEFEVSNLILKQTDEEGNLKLNKEAAKVLLNTYKAWTGDGVEAITSDMSAYAAQIKAVKRDRAITITVPDGTAAGKELSTKLSRKGDRVSYSANSAANYQIVSKGNSQYEVSFFQNTVAKNNKEEVLQWLSAFGINLSTGAADELFEKGLYHNYKQGTFNQQFLTGGLFKVLADNLQFAVDKEGDYSFDASGKTPTTEGVVKSLAALEYKYNNTVTPTGGYINGKNFYPMTQSKFATDRALDLIAQDSKVRDQLAALSFSKNSLYLHLLQNEKFRQNFELSHISFDAMQILGKNLSKDNALGKLSDLDYDVASLGMFWDMNQGTTEDFGNLPMRMATMLMPTMSDKSVGFWLRTAVFNLSNKELNSGREINDDVKKVLYQQVVKPELERMINFAINGGKTNIKSYDEGATLFMMLPKLNELELTPGLTLREAIQSKDLKFKMDIERIEGNKDLMDAIYKTITDTVNELKEEKKAAWKSNGITEFGKEGEVTKINYMDDNYLNKQGKFNGTMDEKLNMVVMDAVVNQMVHLANTFMLFSGDPAQYYKKDGSTEKADYMQIVKDTFVNIGKRLANQAAPGTKLAGSETEQYRQVFINDRKSIGDENFIKYVTKILDGTTIGKEDYDFVKNYLGKSKDTISAEDKLRYLGIQGAFPISSGYFEIEGSDAQEYTTWQEHLNILEKLGKTPGIIQDVTIKDIADARKLFSSNKSNSQLTEKEKALMGLVMQPIKPVYTGQIYDKAQDIMRTMYIKSSSFPLIPQLTEGMEIDKLRVALEKLQSDGKLHVRASYQTANKVGAMKDAIDLWDTDGRTLEDNITPAKLTQSSLILNRKDFRIQQDVPFKSAKNKEDKISMGTQLMKLLFGNDIINFDGFEHDGKTWTGRDLYSEFNRLHIGLVEHKKGQLFDELGLDKTGSPVDYQKSTEKIQQLLQSEAMDRGFPQQVLDGLNLQGEKGNTEFSLPLWSSINSNKFESLLNAIVVNRISKIKFPGNSYVAGSPEGFKTKIKTQSEETITPDVQSHIVYTPSWDGDSLKASYKQDGKVKKVQVLVGSKFRDNDGNLINLLSDDWSSVGEDGVRRINMDKFDSKLFNLTSFRIPTTGLSSAAQIEIVGFLPHDNADLMILPSNLTKQKGLDFDVDKENTYQYWHHLNGVGKFEVMSEAHRTEMLAHADSMNESDNENANNFFDSTFGEDVPYSQDEIDADSKLKKKNADIESKLIQNKIISIYESVLSNPNDKVQAKVNSILNTDFSESEALFIEKMKPQNQPNWTPLSGEYQKQKLALGASGKIGTGAYSMDVVFHSLAQQANAMGRKMELTKIIQGEEGEDSTVSNVNWRFGITGKGGVETDGVLGKTTTQDGGRTTSDLLNENAQIAVDNEKLQIMGKVNLNDLTLDVHKVFNLLGLDKFDTTDKHSIAFLFMSQPILREYVQRLSNSKSNLAVFEAGKREKIINGLLNEYYPEYGTEEVSDEAYSDAMSEENMVKAISSVDAKKSHGQMQAGVLLRFLEMEKYGLAIRNLQTTLNVDSKGLGKSFFDVINKKNKIAKLGDGSFISDAGAVIGAITNGTGLVGEYRAMPDSHSEVQGYLDKGYYFMANPESQSQYLVKPDTFLGAFNVVTAHTAYNIWRDFLPYDSPILQAFYNEITPLIENEGTGSDSKTVENRQTILGEFKKYLASFRTAGFIGKQDDINAERNRLYIDSDTNTSLAKYINELMKVKNNIVVDTFIKSNKLFNSFEIQLNKAGSPSLIKFNNTKGESWDEQYLYESLSNLMEVRGKTGDLTLPTIGNKSYNLATLAQDIINYAMIGNAKQEAIQFTKYVPVQYMNMVGYSYMMRVLHNKLNGRASSESIGRAMSGLGIVEKGDDTKHYVSEFTTQFIQHNPQAVKYTIDTKEANKRIIKEKDKDNSYLLDNDDKPTFIKVYNPSIAGKKKFDLYKFNGESYNKIPILGTFGMDEYQFGEKVGKTIVNRQYDNIVDVKPLLTKKSFNSSNDYSVGNGSVSESVKAIIADKNSPYSALAEALFPYINEDKLEIKSVIALSNGTTITNYLGTWNKTSRVITINPSILSNSDLLAQTILHEVIHGLTQENMDKYIETDDQNNVFIKPNSPQYAQDMVALFNSLKNKVNSTALNKFIDKVNAKGVTEEEKSKYYGYTNIHEFMTMALTDKGFQEILNKIEYKNTNQSLLEKFKNIVKSILEAVGVKFDEKYTAAHAISTIFEVIREGDELADEPANPYEKFTEEDPYKDNDLPNSWDEESGDPEALFSVEPSDYPALDFEIENTECI